MNHFVQILFNKMKNKFNTMSNTRLFKWWKNTFAPACLWYVPNSV